MVEYIQTAIKELRRLLDREEFRDNIQSQFAALRAELHRLAPSEFAPDHRFEFMDLCRRIEQYASFHHEQWELVKVCAEDHYERTPRMDIILQRLGLFSKHGQINKDGYGPNLAQAILDDAKSVLERLTVVLASYLGPAQRRARDFAFMQNVDLRRIADRDYHDVVFKLFPVQAWKSTVILAGSVLEALLHDLLTRDSSRMASANLTTAAKKTKDGIEKGKWGLENYIDVAAELKLIPRDWAGSVHTVLREYRNYVHPLRELKADSLTEGDAFMSVGALIKICDHLANP